MTLIAQHNVVLGKLAQAHEFGTARHFRVSALTMISVLNTIYMYFGNVAKVQCAQLVEYTTNCKSPILETSRIKTNCRCLTITL